MNPFAYDKVGNKTKETDKRGIATTHTYDKLNRLTSTSRDGQLLLKQEYDGNGNLLFATDANNNTTSFSYDRRNLRTAENRLLAAITRFELDSMGNVSKAVDPEGRETINKHDARRRLTSVTNGAGQTTSYEYDGAGNRTRVVHPLGNATASTYDGAGRLKTVSDAAGTHTYGYDKADNHVSYIDALKNETRYEYDELNRRSAVRYPDGASESFAYDAAGNMTGHTDGNGTVITRTFDAVNRETNKHYSVSDDGFTDIGTSYDANNNVVSAEQKGGSTRTSSFSYDRFDRQLTHTDAFGAKVTNTYDANGNKLSMLTQDGQVTRYSYDALNRLTSVVGKSGVTIYAYDRSSLQTRIDYNNGVATVFNYDKAGRVSSVLHQKGGSNLSRTEYEYDSNGNRKKETINRVAGAQVTTYDYDDSDRLTRAVITSADKSVATDYGLDAMANRLTETVTITVGSNAPTVTKRTATYGTRNELKTIDDGSGVLTTLSYDGEGNLTEKKQGGDSTIYRYNGNDNLISVARNGTTLGRYSNDHLGLRIEKEAKDPLQPGAPPVKLRTLWDGRNAFQDRDTGGVVVARYDNNGRHPVGMWHRDDGAQALHRDALGSIVATTDGTGKLKSEIIYDAFGNITEATGQSANKFGYTGHQMDAETGLIYFQARYYDPQLGRFITQDPYEGDARTPLSLHHYLYAYANPTVYVDLNGYESVFKDASAQLDNFSQYLNRQVAQYGNGTALGHAGAVATGTATVVTGLGHGILKPLDYIANGYQLAMGQLNGMDTSAARNDIDASNAAVINGIKGVGTFVFNGGWRKTYETVKEDVKAAADGDVSATSRLTQDGINGALMAQGAVATVKNGAAMASKLKEKMSKPAMKPPVEEAPMPPMKSGVNSEGQTTAERGSGPGVKDAAPNEQALTGQKTAKPEANPERIPCVSCFVAGTLIVVEDGYEAIEDVRVGDLVLSKSDVTGEVAYKPVTHLILTQNKGVLELQLRAASGEIQKIEVTDNHPFWVINRSSAEVSEASAGWVDSGDLKPGMYVSTSTGESLIVESLVPTYTSPDTYNLTVADFHTYFVGRSRIWVHNTTIPCASSELPQLKGNTIPQVEKTLQKKGFVKVGGNAKNQTWKHQDGSEVRVHRYGNQNPSGYKSGNNAHVHKEAPNKDQLTDRGVRSIDPDETHIGIKNPQDLPTVRGRPHGDGS